MKRNQSPWKDPIVLVGIGVLVLTIVVLAMARTAEARPRKSAADDGRVANATCEFYFGTDRCDPADVLARLREQFAEVNAVTAFEGVNGFVAGPCEWITPQSTICTADAALGVLHVHAGMLAVDYPPALYFYGVDPLTTYTHALCSRYRPDNVEADECDWQALLEWMDFWRNGIRNAPRGTDFVEVPFMQKVGPPSEALAILQNDRREVKRWLALPVISLSRRD